MHPGWICGRMARTRHTNTREVTARACNRTIQIWYFNHWYESGGQSLGAALEFFEVGPMQRGHRIRQGSGYQIKHRMARVQQ